MAQAAKLTRENRTITVDFHDETTYFGLLGTPHAFVEFVLAFLLALGFQLLHKASCSEGRGLTRTGLNLRVSPNEIFQLLAFTMMLAPTFDDAQECC